MKLIDADRLKQEIATIMPSRIEVNLVVDAQPDAVVRCKDCKHKEESVSPSWEAWCNRLHCGCDLDWFCADGERRT